MSLVKRAVNSLRRRLGLKKPPKFNPDLPFGTEIKASKDEYLALAAELRGKSYPKIDAFLANYAHQIDEAWMHDLALHTQVCVKVSPLNIQHGRLLYSVLRRQVDDNPSVEAFNILETGTSRGFSAVLMAKALQDGGKQGRIVTLDQIGHNNSHLWNCIDDHDGPKTRAQLLSSWPDQAEMICFLGGNTREIMPKIGMSRIHFAFLDGAHHYEDVIAEFNYVAARQKTGDTIFYDDVTKTLFPEIYRAVKEIEALGDYEVTYLHSSTNRGYAVGIRK